MTIADVVPSRGTRSTRGRVPAYKFLLNGEEFDITVSSANVSLSEGKHDQATVKATSATLEDTEGIVDSTISFRWGVSPRIENFTGYVTDVQEESAQGSATALSFTLTILGATKTMYEGRPRYWSNKSIPNTVRDLVAHNGLGYVGHDHTHLWRGLAQTTESDWGYITFLTNRIGFRLFNRYGVVMCYDPNKLFAESGAYARLVMSSVTTYDLDLDRTLLDFQPMETAEVVKGNLGAQFGFFSTGNEVQTAKQPGDFKGYVFSTDVVIDDQEAADVYAKAAELDMDGWNQHAIARVWGDADLYPGLCVEIVTTNKRYMKTKYDGRWLIRATNHALDRQQYQTVLYLSRPSSAAPVRDTAYQPFWQDGSETRPRPYLYISTANAGTPDERTGVWISSWFARRAANMP